MRLLRLALALLLVGCGDSRLSDGETRAPVGELANEDSFAVSGRSRLRLYMPNRERTGGETPITITDGDSFAVQIDGVFSGETIYLEIDGIVREVFIEAKAGETQFIAP